MLNEGREGSGGGTEERHNQVVWTIDVASRGVGKFYIEYDHAVQSGHKVVDIAMPSSVNSKVKD